MLPLPIPHSAHAYLTAFIDELARAGVAHVCICPGSRSTPLAMLFAQQSAIKMWMHLDERAAAFFALGLAKVQRTPVLLLCTSGTAAANFYPAIIEAHYARVPLIILTADRPPELRDTGAPQTIDQNQLYGRYAKWFVEMALPEATAEMLRYARAIASRAVAQAHTAPAGVVHLNFPLREPLVPEPSLTPIEDNAPHPRVHVGVRVPDSQLMQRLSAELMNLPRGLIIVGPQTDPALPLAVTRLAEALGYPLLADPLSQVRCGPHHSAVIIDTYDAFLRDAATAQALAPQIVLRFGAMPTSKPVLLYLQQHCAARHIVIGDGGDWPDSPRLAAEVIEADAPLLCDELRVLASSPPPSAWLTHWQRLNAQTRVAIQLRLVQFTEVFEGRVFTELAACLPDPATVFVSSSMPVRDLDTFFPGSPQRVQFFANRGANGIDGVVSSALGASAVAPAPLVLVIGDIAFYHDLNGLLAAKQHGLRATIIVINNDGGGIFSFLPQAAHPQHFEQLFGTPHGLTFRAAAELYGAAYVQPSDWAAFRAALTESFTAPGLTLIELHTERPANVTLHREIWKAVAHQSSTKGTKSTKV